MFTTEDNAANARWDAPDEADVTAWDQLRAMPAWFRALGTRLFRPGMAAFRAVQAAHPKQEHYYLWMVGVRRDRQGQGLGSAVLAPMLERCDAEGVPAYLENSNPKNEAFYARHGFVALEPIHLPAGAPPLTPMWREPR